MIDLSHQGTHNTPGTAIQVLIAIKVLYSRLYLRDHLLDMPASVIDIKPSPFLLLSLSK
jgi:hypothetical protein